MACWSACPFLLMNSARSTVNVRQKLTDHCIMRHEVERPIVSDKKTFCGDGWRLCQIGECGQCVHSPARVVSACWNGTVARSIEGANCCKMVRATNRFVMSCAMRHLTLLVGLRKFVIRPMRMAANFSGTPLRKGFDTCSKIV